MADPCKAGVKMKKQMYDIITTCGNAGGVCNIDREHCTPIS